MLKNIYLDNSATTPLCEAAKNKMMEAMETYGNPSSLHPIGQAAHALLEEARKEIAATLGIRNRLAAGQLIFTSGGSESDHLAIFGTAFAKERRRQGRIITTDSEHAATENTLRSLEAKGFEVVRISTKGGVLDFDQYQSALNDRTFLVTMMMVNNETGAQYDVARAFSMAKAKREDIVTHCDAVQGYLKARFTPGALHADLLTLSAHKIHAPKGVGALYVSLEALKRRDIVPVLLGGGQESGFRSGTENVIGIAAFGAAAKDGFSCLPKHLPQMAELRAYAIELFSRLPVKLHLPQGACAPHILNFALPDIKSETMVHALSEYGICLSSGSACSTHSKQLSQALLAFGVPADEVECSLRVSLSRYSTREEIEALAQALEQTIPRLVKIHR